MSRVFAASLLAGLAVGACSITIQESTVFQPPEVAAKAAVEESMRIDGEDQILGEIRHVLVENGQGRLAVTHIFVPGRPAGAPLILACMGNAADRIRAGAAYANKLLPYGDVMLFDYPGYGDSDGAAVIAQLLEARAPLIAEAERVAQGRPILLWGHSLGGFVCAQMAKSSPLVSGVVLETTAVNAVEVAQAWKPWYLPFLTLKVHENLSGFDTAEALAGGDWPVLVIGAGKDDTLPVRLHRSLAKALREKGLAVTYLEYPTAEHWNASLVAGFRHDLAPFMARIASPPD